MATLKYLRYDYVRKEMTHNINPKPNQTMSMTVYAKHACILCK